MSTDEPRAEGLEVARAKPLAVAMSKALRVLIIDDSPSDAVLITRALSKLSRPIASERVESEAQLAEALARSDWDAFVCDWSMPSFGALAALEMVRASGRDRPFVVVSGTVGEETAVTAMRAGAHDYVLKDNLTRLAPAIERELRECAGRAARREAELALRRQDARFKAMIDKTADVLLMLDADSIVTYATQSCQRLLGRPIEAIIGQHIADLSPIGDRALAAERLAALFAEAKPVSAPRVRQVRTADGDDRLMEVRATNLLDDPEVGAMLLHMIDVTERHRNDEARQKAEAALARSEDQLRQSQKMEAIGRLAGGVAHDFNNLLSVILTYSILIHHDLPQDSPIRAELDEVVRAGRRAAELTRQLLMFSRQQALEPEVVDINVVLANIAKLCGRVLGEDIETVTTLSERVGRVRVDPGGIEQIVMNLVVNARDAMPTGGKLVLETAQVLLDAEYAAAHLGVVPGPYVMLAVSDNGVGMDRAVAARIFEPFFTTKEKGKGTGLGLSTVFGLVQQSGGTVWVYSELGKGTTFKVYLPSVDLAPTITNSAMLRPVGQGNETILLVEDEDQVRVAARGMLRRFGYTVLEAAGSDEALALADQHSGHIDLLLTDVVMPRMSGPELAHQLRIERPYLKVLCMSGYTDDSVVRHGLIEGTMAFIQKPIVPDTLASKLRAVLDRPET